MDVLLAIHINERKEPRRILCKNHDLPKKRKIILIFLDEHTFWFCYLHIRMICGRDVCL